jgi:hypothetical protein
MKDRARPVHSSVRLNPDRSGSHSGGHNAQAAAAWQRLDTEAPEFPNYRTRTDR